MLCYVIVLLLCYLSHSCAQIIRIRSKDGNFRFDLKPSDHASVLQEKACLPSLPYSLLTLSDFCSFSRRPPTLTQPVSPYPISPGETSSSLHSSETGHCQTSASSVLLVLFLPLHPTHVFLPDTVIWSSCHTSPAQRFPTALHHLLPQQAQILSRKIL